MKWFLLLSCILFTGCVAKQEDYLLTAENRFLSSVRSVEDNILELKASGSQHQQTIEDVNAKLDTLLLMNSQQEQEKAEMLVMKNDKPRQEEAAKSFRGFDSIPDISKQDKGGKPAEKVVSTAVCQCKGYDKSKCFCLQNGQPCKCNQQKGSEWNVENGRAVNKTGRYFNPSTGQQQSAVVQYTAPVLQGRWVRVCDNRGRCRMVWQR